MNYPAPEHRATKPVTGEEARALLTAIDSGESLASEAATETACRILARRAKNAHDADNQSTGNGNTGNRNTGLHQTEE